jgi:hypothetical protein
MKVNHAGSDVYYQHRVSQDRDLRLYKGKKRLKPPRPRRTRDSVNDDLSSSPDPSFVDNNSRLIIESASDEYVFLLLTHFSKLTPPAFFLAAFPFARSSSLKMEPFLLPAQPVPPSPEPQRPTQSSSRRDPSTVAAASSSSTSEATAGLPPSLDPGHDLEDNDGPPSSTADVVTAADDGGITSLEEIHGDGKEGGIKRWKEEDEAEEVSWAYPACLRSKGWS